jgi:hypothetical protein
MSANTPATDAIASRRRRMTAVIALLGLSIALTYALSVIETVAVDALAPVGV